MISLYWTPEQSVSNTFLKMIELFVAGRNTKVFRLSAKWISGVVRLYAKSVKRHKWKFALGGTNWVKDTYFNLSGQNCAYPEVNKSTKLNNRTSFAFALQNDRYELFLISIFAIFPKLLEMIQVTVFCSASSTVKIRQSLGHWIYLVNVREGSKKTVTQFVCTTNYHLTFFPTGL